MDGLVLPEKLTNELLAVLDGGSVVAVATGVAKVFAWCEESISEEGRESLGRLLTNASPDVDIESWGQVFPSMIDRVFGPKALTIKFIFRSCLASLLSLSIVLFILWRMGFWEGGLLQAPEDLWYIFSLNVVVNFIPDFCSLLISRSFIRIIVRKPTMIRALAILVSDTFVTAVLAAIGVTIGYIGFSIQIGHFVLGLDDHLSDYMPNRLFKEFFSLDYKTFLPFYLSSFFTSIWLWLYITALAVLKVFHYLFASWFKLSPYLELKKKPLTAAGRVAGLIAGGIYALFIGILWIARHPK